MKTNPSPTRAGNSFPPDGIRPHLARAEATDYSKITSKRIQSSVKSFDLVLDEEEIESLGRLSVFPHLLLSRSGSKRTSPSSQLKARQSIDDMTTLLIHHETSAKIPHASAHSRFLWIVNVMAGSPD